MTVARLLDAAAVMRAADHEYYHFATGLGRGGPWRHDSIYLRVDDFALLEGPITEALPLFVKHGVSEVAAEAVPELRAAIERYASNVRQASGAAQALGDDAADLPGLKQFANWSETRDALEQTALGVVAWIDEHGLDRAGLTIIKQ